MSVRMQKPPPYVRIAAVLPRAAIISVFCLVFLATRGLGVHLHGAYEEQGAHEHTGVQLQIEVHPDHLDAHLVDGEVDIDSSVLIAKPVDLKYFAMLLVFACLLVGLIRPMATRILLPPDRPPRRSLSPYLLPPSHAPPRAA